jgi:hypothetical protein
LVYISEGFEAKWAITSFSEDGGVEFVYLGFVDEGLELLVSWEHLKVVVECSFLMLLVIHIMYHHVPRGTDQEFTDATAALLAPVLDASSKRNNFALNEMAPEAESHQEAKQNKTD